MVAGPSEVSIIADKYSNPNWIAADLIAQAEHDVFSQSILISNNKDFIKSVDTSIKSQLANLPKKEIASKSIKNYGLAIYTKSQNQISDIINIIAPEHLEIDIRNSNNILKKLKTQDQFLLANSLLKLLGII